MFSLSAVDLEKRILGCADGPASFNAQLTKRGGRIVSADPVYQFSREEIFSRITATRREIIEQVRENKHEFVWDHIFSVEELERTRVAAMEVFMEDFETNSDRYVCAELPELPFKNNSFDLALCSHFIFLYSEQKSLDFHIASVMELLRLAPEVRIFPLLELGARPSRHLDAVTKMLEKNAIWFETCDVDYEFQKGGNKMLRIRL